ncbi:MAG: hypothetical protein HPY66_3305 [Firmicutes bacterium]|nr:hypothetical protein [Bacillota bacterium]MDI6705310.1 GT-D fold domain-containing glycosyltransferase [Bacillota bacterium]
MGKTDDVIINKIIKGEVILDTNQVYEYVKNSLKNKEKASVVRIGDGEALTLAQQVVLPWKQVASHGFLRYAGVKVPDFKGRDALALSIKQADIVGVPINMMPNFLPLTVKAFKAHNIDLNKMKLTNACINYFLYNTGKLKSIVIDEKPRVLIIGNKGKELSRVLKRAGANVVGVISPVSGLNDIDRVVRSALKQNFDLALVAAGVPAVIICERIANGKGKVALDIGHVANNIVKSGRF